MQELINATCNFLEKEPEARYEELMQILRYQDPEQLMDSLAIILPACSTEEQIIITEHLGQDAVLDASTVPDRLFSIFFNDILIDSGPDALASLCAVALKCPYPEVRRNMLSHIENGRIGVTGPISSEIILMLGDPEGDIRELAADVLSTGGENDAGVPPEQLFLNAFYLGGVNAARHLAERMESQDMATAFVYLCLTRSPFGPARGESMETSKEILGAFYSLHDKSKIDFQETVDAGLHMYCSRRKRFSGLNPNEENVLRRGLKHFVKGAKRKAAPCSEAQKPRRKRPSKAPNRTSQLPHRPTVSRH